MNEIERRWLLSSKRTVEFNGEPLFIEQGYVVSNKTHSVRIRKQNGKHFLTIKSGSGMSRKETEIEIDRQQYLSLLPLCEKRVIRKIRYKYPIYHDPQTFIQFYAEEDHFFYPIALNGHKQIEVEFASVEEAELFTAPAWFGKEVTDDGRYTNASLAEFGLPEENQ